jgi:hypothetical protein
MKNRNSKVDFSTSASLVQNGMLGDVSFLAFKEKYPESILVDKLFGDGRKLIYIGFNEHRRIGLKYIVRVDSSTVIYDMHDLAEEIENYLVEEFAMFDRHEDFEEWCKENDLDSEINNDKFDGWFKDQFPMVDIDGGSSNWDVL